MNKSDEIRAWGADLLDSVPQGTIEKFHLDRLPLARPSTSTHDLLRLDEQVFVVTGGGGVGLGNSICHRLAEQGAKIAVLDAVESWVETTATALDDRWNIDTLALVGNVSDPDDAAQMVGKAVERFGRLDGLVNNAGGSTSVTVDTKRMDVVLHFAEERPQSIAATVAVNLLGAMYMSQAALAHMLPRSSGVIINIGSSSAYKSVGQAAYAASKAGMSAFGRNLAKEVGRQGIRVVTVNPGVMVNRRLLDADRFSNSSAFAEALSDASIDRCALPDEVASVVAFLASSAGGYIHGAEVNVAGGL